LKLVQEPHIHCAGIDRDKYIRRMGLEVRPYLRQRGQHSEDLAEGIANSDHAPVGTICDQLHARFAHTMTPGTAQLQGRTLLQQGLRQGRAGGIAGRLPRKDEDSR
jgi:hypothetical protein